MVENLGERLSNTPQHAEKGTGTIPSPGVSPLARADCHLAEEGDGGH